jgi:hypothetical protein
MIQVAILIDKSSIPVLPRMLLSRASGRYHGRTVKGEHLREGSINDPFDDDERKPGCA